MKVKVQINDKVSFDELLSKAPEVEVKIKESIVDAVGKRAANAAEAVLKSAFDLAVEHAVSDACSALGTPEKLQVFTRTPYGRVCLTTEARAIVRQEINNCLIEKIREVVQATDVMAPIEASIKQKVEEIRGIDPTRILRLEAKNGVYSALQKFIDAARSINPESEAQA